MTARDALREIRERADKARSVSMSGTEGWRVRDSSVDVPRLLDALTAALDLHQRVDAAVPWCFHCIGPADGQRWVEYPCPTVRIIAEALGSADGS